MSDRILKVAGLVVVSVSIPTAISALIFDTIPSWIHLLLLALLPVAAVHPIFGFDISNSLGLLPEAPVVKEEVKKDEKVLSFTKPDTYIQNLQPLREMMLDLCDLEKNPASATNDTDWKIMLTQQKQDYTCSVQKRKDKDFFFRIVVDFEATPEEAFDFMSDIGKRPQWDEICQDAGTVERISHKTSIQVYMTN
jgi:hypothetical protein